MEWLIARLARLKPQFRLRLNADFNASLYCELHSERPKASPDLRGLEHAACGLGQLEGATERCEAIGRQPPAKTDNTTI